MDVGMLIGDRLDRPWYRSIFTNIADVVSPEILPPLELTSSPVDVGELLGDDMAHGWWHSLLGTLRDRLSPERLPALELTSQPFAPFEADTWLQILDWSSLLDTPKVYLPDAPRADESYVPLESPIDVVVTSAGACAGDHRRASTIQERHFALPASPESVDVVGCC